MKAYVRGTAGNFSASTLCQDTLFTSYGATEAVAVMRLEEKIDAYLQADLVTVYKYNFQTKKFEED